MFQQFCKVIAAASKDGLMTFPLLLLQVVSEGLRCTVSMNLRTVSVPKQRRGVRARELQTGRFSLPGQEYQAPNWSPQIQARRKYETAWKRKKKVADACLGESGCMPVTFFSIAP